MQLSGLRLGDSRKSRGAVHIAIRGLAVSMAAGPGRAMSSLCETGCVKNSRRMTGLGHPSRRLQATRARYFRLCRIAVPISGLKKDLKQSTPAFIPGEENNVATFNTGVIGQRRPVLDLAFRIRQVKASAIGFPFSVSAIWTRNNGGTTIRAKHRMYSSKQSVDLSALKVIAKPPIRT
jgi:hypothetical protein